MFSRKIKLVLTQEEYRLIIDCLNEWRNKLIQEGGYTDAIDDLVIKIFK
jgi:hypothetical protein